ncbi:hypothetical protein RND81_07G075400 [Saponaria officinalis]|uniref:Pre-mRNA-splicing factor SYF1 n=1 Tax=Saponaria officinalis TaxID=3572 RepID=A0AAW1JL47_SAPOF
MKAVGKPYTLWVAFAKLYETHNDLANARVIFDKAVQVNYKAVDHLASVWCEWAEMELKHKNFKGALQLMRRATTEPYVEVKRRVAGDGHEPVQMKVHKSLKLWAFYVDLEESLGDLESTRAVYERILDLRITTPQIILNYAMLLEEHKYFEDAFRVYERGVKIFKYPHVKDIWVTYLSKFVRRYKSSKLEQARELFDNAVETAPAECVKPLFLQYVKLEEDYGLAKQAMNVYDKATKTSPSSEKLNMYEIYIDRAAEIFGVPQTREIYEQEIPSALPDKDVMTMCMKYAELEKSLGEIDRARAIYTYASQFVDPRTDPDFWTKWNDFEVQHGNEDMFREMLRIRRTVAASFSQLAPPPDRDITVTDKTMTLGFVRVGHESQSEAMRTDVNQKDIELPDENDVEDDEKVEIAQKDVPSVVFGGLAKKRDKPEIGEDGVESKVEKSRLGALERIKRRKTNP